MSRLVFSLFALLIPHIAGAVPRFGRLEAGNDYYRVMITPADGRRVFPGHYAAWTGPEHPVTALLDRPGEMHGLLRDCLTCGGADDGTFSAVRSFTSGTDYLLAWNPNPLLEPSPGFECVDANGLRDVELEHVFEGGEAVGVRGTWEILNSSDDLTVEILLKVHGEDYVDGAVEISLTVRNHGLEPVALGLRHVWALRLSGSMPAAGARAKYYVGTRTPDPPAEPFTEFETEWEAPQFRMWQIHSLPEPSRRALLYSTAAAVSGPSTLDPEPTAPDLIQQAGYNFHLGASLPGGGSGDACFDWRIPEPPRPVGGVDLMTMVSYWGPTEDNAITVDPGNQVTVTQYLVAFEKYPLIAVHRGPYSAECQGDITELPMNAASGALEPTAAEIQGLWTSDSPRVSFVDPTDPLTLARVEGTGVFPVTFTATVGAYEQATKTTITVSDSLPPRLTGVPADTTVACDAVPAPASVSVADVCDEAPALFFEEERRNGPCPQSYDLLRTWTGSDASGHTSTAEQLVQVVDTLAPVVTASLELATPLAPSPPSSVCSTPTSAVFRVRAAASDACDGTPELTARLLVTHHDVLPSGGTSLRVDEVLVSDGELVELRIVAPPCPARGPRSPRLSLSVNSAGLKLVTGESIVLSVQARDACGNTATVVLDPTVSTAPCPPGVADASCCPSLQAPVPPRCGGRGRDGRGERRALGGDRRSGRPGRRR